jgi:hypothetical protein
VKFTEEPDRVAVTIAELAAVTVVAVAEKLAEVEPAAAVTEVGTVSRLLLSESVTTAPPAGDAVEGDGAGGGAVGREGGWGAGEGAGQSRAE